MLTFVSTLAVWLTARAGSGSAGFGGGGRSFSGGGTYGGRGGGGFLFVGGGAGGGVLLAMVLLAIVLVVVPLLIQRTRAARRAQARDARDAEVRRAAAAAAEDDPAFAAEALLGQTSALVLAVQDAWDAQDRARLGAMLGPDLLREWTRRLDDFARRGWADRVKITGRPQLRLAAIVNRADDADDRVVVHVTLPIDSWVETPQGPMFPVGQVTPQTVLSEYWTLAKRDSRWILVSIEQEEEGEHHLRSVLVTDPSDDPELASRSRTALATADAAVASPAQLLSLVSTGFSDDAHAAALDLSLVDDRCSPDVLRIAVDETVAAWATAIDGADDALERRADPHAVDALLYGGDASERTRTVVRGPRVDEVTIERIAAATPGVGPADVTASMQVQLRYHARWYREDRDTAAVLEGSRDVPTERTARWTFALTDDVAYPWRLTSVSG